VLGDEGFWDYRQNSPQGLVNEELATPALQAERAPLRSRFSDLLSEVFDSFSFAFFHLSFSCLILVFSSWCNRLLAEE
jgi:hypothetical protein